ncbi:phage tail spike protein [Mammaliicoccus sciuri]|uniref:phage tail spike protein n=1 Tax=Mammaliicoccus sciuri TaxID=1296 RepID=UPI00243646E3|nr:phage tail spike protein [Mammaliicoccus sciuri]
MIHVLNFEGKIIDFISQSDSTIIRAEHNRDINERTETFDFTILSKRTEHLQEKNRIIIEDSNKQFREFIIEHISQDIDGYTEIETTASYFEDLANAKPYGPSTLSKMTTKQALSDVLKDTGWEVSNQTEYGGIRTTSWTSYQTRYEVLLQLCTTYNMMPDYYIELGNNTVEGRYVVLRERNPMFNGKEIAYGKDLIGLKRTVDFTDVKTALVCVGPEKDDGSRIELIVKDDEAQENFGLPGRYSWGIYEPESDDQNMTEARLRTLGLTELNKRKSELINYEVTSTDINKIYKHEVTHLGDMVRIKNRDFTPPLYVEVEVISEQFDMIAEESTYGFGQYKEYRESELRNEFDKKLSDIRQKMHDNISNVNTIIQDTISGELEFYEKKIIKSDTPPKNPVDDMLWLDTSNPDVMVLWRYFNGEWREHSVKDVEKIGGITREKAMFSELSNTFINLSIQHSKLLSDVYEVINSEYFVDTDLKNEVNSKLNDTIGVFNQIKNNLDSMTPETAKIGKLIDTQLLFLTYRERMQSLYKAVENAKISIDDRFKLLQSQYTEEKFNEAMQKVADKFGFEYTNNGFLVGDSSLISGAIQALREDTNEQFKTVVKKVDYDADQSNIIKRMNTADSERIQLENEIADRVTLTEYNKTKDKIDNLKVGGKNLVLNSYGKYTNHTSYGKYYDLSEDWIVGETYTVTLKGQPNTNHYFSAYIDDGYSNLCTLKYDETTGLWKGTGIAGTSTRNKPNLLGVYDMPKDGNYNATIEWIQLEKATISTDYEKAPEDTDKRLTKMETSIEQNGQQINLKASRDELNNSKKTLSRVLADLTVNTTDGLTLTYDENGSITSHVVGPNGIKIRGDKVDIQANSNFSVLIDDVNSKVDKNSIVSSINATPERIDINTQNVGIFGGTGQSYIKIKNDEIESSGRYTRTWFDKTTTNNVRFRVRNGYSYMENIDEDKRLYFTDKGISTFISGYSDENPNYESHGSGVIEFFSHQYDPDIRGLTLFSNRGTIALQTKARDIILDSDRDIRINTNRGSIFLEMNSVNRPGDNTFNFYIKNNDSASDTDGVLRFGSKRLNYSSGLRFEKTTEGKPMIYVTNGNGDKFTGSIDVVDIHIRGDIRAPQDFSLRTIDGTGYRALTASTYASYNSIAFRSHSGRNVYFGVGLNELRITDNNGYQENDTRYKPILSSDFVKASREEFKEDIKLWNYDALNVIVKELQLYSYKYKDDERGLIQHGPVIGDQYETPTEFIFGDGINTNEMLSFALRAIQQLNDKIKILEGITNE